MDLCTIDFETFYSKDYSLSKMTTESYINDIRFEVIGVAVKRNNEQTQWFTGTYAETKRWLMQFDWGNSMVVAHNAMFDAAILGWRFGIFPKTVICTLSMARALHAVSVGGSLAALSEYYKLGVKGTEVLNALGKRRADFSKAEIDAYGGYCVNDVELTYKLFKAMLPRVPKPELKLIDMTIRMYSDPELKLDTEMLYAHLADVKEQKEKLLDECGISKEDLMSNQKFASVLEMFGVEPPMKLNSKGVESFAFAKTDEGFKALAEHDDPRVQAIVAARLGTKSTLEETRTERFIAIAERPYRGNVLPVPLHYYGARTGRWAATDKINLQNLPRKSKLKGAIIAPEGYVIVGADLSAIELRMGLAFAGQLDKMHMLGQGIDLYKDFASTVYGVPISEINDEQRFMGKTCIAEGELVLTDRGLIPIQDIMVDDKVWDGVEWVNHDGLIYQGEKDVITYQGLTATPDHRVYLEDGTPCEFGIAANKGARIVTTGNGTQEIRILGNNINRNKKEQQSRRDAYLSEMQVQAGEMDTPRITNPGVIKTMLLMWVKAIARCERASYSRRQSYGAATKESYSNNTAMPKSERQKLSELWGKGYSVRIFLCERFGSLFKNIKWMGLWARNRQNRQQRELCKGEYSFFYTERTECQQTEYALCGVERGENFSRGVETKPVCSNEYRMQICETGYDRRADNPERLGFSHKEMQELEGHKSKVRVYDLLNAGPRRRFTVNNLLVSNCQLSLIYGTGSVKLRNQVKLMSGKDIGEEEAKRIVNLYRSEYTHVVDAWGEGDEVLEAVMHNNAMYMGRNNLITVHGSEGALLPSGIYMRYPDLRKDVVQTTRGQRLEWSVLKNRRERDKLYGSKVFQGLTQALARCIIAESMLRIDKKYRVLLTIHDAVYLLAPEDEADDVLRFVIQQLRVPPAWMPDIPLDAEGGFGRSLEFKMGKVL